VTDAMTQAEIKSEYEKNTGEVIVRAFQEIDYASVPGVLVASHAPFAWGPDAAMAAHNAVVLEAVARMAYVTVTINESASAIGRDLHDKHHLRKHGSDAYYGQAKQGK
jgi:L-ribulose-5-phosphate 4-epimerase